MRVTIAILVALSLLGVGLTLAPAASAEPVCVTHGGDIACVLITEGDCLVGVNPPEGPLSCIG